MVRWKGYGVEHDEYIPLANFEECLDPVREYWRTHQPVERTGSGDLTEEEQEESKNPVEEPLIVNTNTITETTKTSPGRDLAQSQGVQDMLINTFDSDDD